MLILYVYTCIWHKYESVYYCIQRRIKNVLSKIYLCIKRQKIQGGSNMTGTDLCKQAAQVPVIFEPPCTLHM
jgi:hypothetical protein